MFILSSQEIRILCFSDKKLGPSFTPKRAKMSSLDGLPFTLSPVGEEEAELRRRVFAGPCSALREGVLVAEPGGVRWVKIGSYSIKIIKSRMFQTGPSFSMANYYEHGI